MYAVSTRNQFAMLVPGLLISLLWLGRRQEVELLWHSISAPLRFLCNYQYFAEITPFKMVWFNALSVHATYYAGVATAAFYFYFNRMPGRNRVIVVPCAGRQAALRRAIVALGIEHGHLHPDKAADFQRCLAGAARSQAPPRYRAWRAGPVLDDAGIACKWHAEPCAALPWLDAASALHVLRILQEAIGNVLAHSGATQMRIGCRESSPETLQNPDRGAGVVIYVIDNGTGFDASAESAGKGLGNMRSRARSLHGTWACESSVNAGTSITLWLPYARTR